METCLLGVAVPASSSLLGNRSSESFCRSRRSIVNLNCKGYPVVWRRRGTFSEPQFLWNRCIRRRSRTSGWTEGRPRSLFGAESRTEEDSLAHSSSPQNPKTERDTGLSNLRIACVTTATAILANAVCGNALAEIWASTAGSDKKSDFMFVVMCISEAIALTGAALGGILARQTKVELRLEGSAPSVTNSPVGSGRMANLLALGPSVWVSELHRGASIRHDVRAYSRKVGLESRSCNSGRVGNGGVSAWRPKRRLSSGSSSRAAAANIDLSAVDNQAAGERFSSSSAEPNQTVLEALTKVCTGPTQTKPLDEAQAFKVLDTILRSAKGELQGENPVSLAQLGAFFGAMTLRANAFPAATNWSEGEGKALAAFWPSFTKFLPEEILFLADPEGTLFGDVYHKGQAFRGRGVAEARLVGALREVLTGSHLGYEEVCGLLGDLLPLNSSDSDSSNGGGGSYVSEALIAAFLIIQRMNKETDAELKAYCMAFDDELGTLPTADVKSLTHYGDPYDGNTRFFRSTLFVAAVRASYGEACLLYGVDWMPPKGGITEEQAIRHLGGSTTLSPSQAARFLEDDRIGFAYVSQREARPSLYSLVGLRKHIKKRPPIATTEKVQRYVKATGREATMAGFYHEGYEDPLLMLIRRRGMDAGLVVKGEEGALSLTTKSKSADAVVRGRPLNFCTGFRPGDPNTCIQVCDGVPRESFSVEVVASEYGFEPSGTPRVGRSVAQNVGLGLAALRGEKGPAYDRIVLNAAMADHLLGCDGAPDPQTAIERAKHAIDSGRALQHLMAYLERSKKVSE